jgi:hypothetical protein
MSSSVLAVKGIDPARFCELARSRWPDATARGRGDGSG